MDNQNNGTSIKIYKFFHSWFSLLYLGVIIDRRMLKIPHPPFIKMEERRSQQFNETICYYYNNMGWPGRRLVSFFQCRVDNFSSLASCIINVLKSENEQQQQKRNLACPWSELSASEKGAPNVVALPPFLASYRLTVLQRPVDVPRAWPCGSMIFIGAT